MSIADSAPVAYGRDSYPNAPITDEGASYSLGVKSCSSHAPIFANTGPITMNSPGDNPMHEFTPEPSLSHLTIAHESPSLLQADISECDIELEVFPRPISGAYSTDHLLPPLSSSTSLENSVSTPESPSTESTAKQENEANAAVPNYKPFPLRWPFSVFLFAVIAGLFGVLEYQVHNLPPMHYSVLEMADHPAPADRTKQTAAPGPDPDPDPDPRLHESSFPNPNPILPRNTYCGWEAPTWGVTTTIWRPAECATLADDDCWLRAEVFFNEFIGTFTSDDPTWCPCRILSPDKAFRKDWGRTGLDESGGILRWDTTDDKCRSAMIAIVSMNEFKEAGWWTTVSTKLVGDDGPYFDFHRELYAQSQLTTPPLEIHRWHYPKTDAQGNILFPMVTRTVGLWAGRDVFGNMVESTDSALFPQDFVPRTLNRDSGTGSMDSYENPCYRVEQYPGRCNSTAQFSVAFSTVWWTLPLSLRAVSSVVETPTATTTTPTVVSESHTSTALERLTSPVWPTRTSCCGTGITSQGSLGSINKESSTTTTALLISMGKMSSTQTTILVSNPEAPPALSSAANTTETVFDATRHSRSGISISSAPGTPFSITSLVATGTVDVVASSQGNPAIAFSSLVQTEPGQQTSISPTASSITEISSAPNSASGSITANEPAMKPEKTDAANHFTKTSLGSPVGVTENGDTSHASALRPSTSNSESIASATPPTRAPTQINEEPTLQPSTPSTLQSSSTTPIFLPSPLGPAPPRPRPNGPVAPDTQSNYFNLRSEADYLMVSVIPVLLATLLLVLLQVQTTSLGSVLPIRALGHSDRGALSSDSLCLCRSASVLESPFIAVRFVREFRDILPMLGFLVGVLSTLLVALSSEVIRLEVTTSSEVIRLEVTTDCSSGTSQGGAVTNDTLRDEGFGYPVRVCEFGLRKSPSLMRVAEGLLVTLGILVLGIAFLLHRWKSGVAADPWSIASMASLIRLDGELHGLLLSLPTDEKMPEDHASTHVRRILDGRRFRLEASSPRSTAANTAAARSNVVEVVPMAAEDHTPIKPTTRDPPAKRKHLKENSWVRRCWSISSMAWEPVSRISALLFTAGLLILILYFENTVGVDTGFERFMDSQTFGVRILFAAFGTTINAFWNSYFSYTSESQIHQLLARKPHQARTSILLSPPTNVFVVLWRCLVGSTTKGNTDWLLSLNIALASLFAKFTPIVLSNIPFSNAMTWKIHEACTWLAVAFLSHMVLVLLASLVVLPPRTGIQTRKRGNSRDGLKKGERKEGVAANMACEMPVRTDTISGCMYYVYESRMLQDFEGLSGMGRKERDKLVSGMDKRYWLGEGVVVGERGRVSRRMRVDYK